MSDKNKPSGVLPDGYLQEILSCSTDFYIFICRSGLPVVAARRGNLYYVKVLIRFFVRNNMLHRSSPFLIRFKRPQSQKYFHLYKYLLFENFDKLIKYSSACSFSFFHLYCNMPTTKSQYPFPFFHKVKI